MSTQASPSEPPRKSSAERTRRWRERMRAKGLVPRTVWTYDLKDPAFLARLQADCAKIKGSKEEARILDEIGAMYELDEPAPEWIEPATAREKG